MNKRILIGVLCGIFVCLGIGSYLVRAGVIQPPRSEPVIDSTRLYMVTHIDDGDTFRINADAYEVRVRMLGVNTPETVDTRKKVQCFGPEASTHTKLLLKRQKVRLNFSPDRELKDGYGRYLAYVYREDGLFVNKYLLENGFAREYTVGTPYDRQDEFKTAQADAKNALKGLWAKCVSKDDRR